MPAAVTPWQLLFPACRHARARSLLLLRFEMLPPAAEAAAGPLAGTTKPGALATYKSPVLMPFISTLAATSTWTQQPQCLAVAWLLLNPWSPGRGKTARPIRVRLRNHMQTAIVQQV